MRKVFVRVLDRVPPSVARRFGSGTRLARLARPLVNRALPQGFVELRVGSGIARGARLLVDAQREKYYVTGTYEEHVQRALERLLRPGAVFWDVGAHAGFFTVAAARLVGPDGHVLAVEPMDENRRRLLEAVRLNQLENVEIAGVAVGAAAGEHELRAHGSTSMWSLHGDGDGGQRVQVVTLDELARGRRRPDLIKVDVEQVELAVLQAGREVLASAAAIVEFTSPDLVDEARALFPGRTIEPLGAEHWLLR
jgi:FkbM family methyltransferase